MIVRPARITTRLIAVVATVVFIGPAAIAQQPISVRGMVILPGGRGESLVASAIDADPRQPTTVLACAGGGAAATSAPGVAYLSTDAGGSWRDVRRVPDARDVTCRIGADGRLILQYERVAGPRVRVLTDRSSDGGRSWSSTQRTTTARIAELTVDRSASANRGRAFSVGPDIATATNGTAQSALEILISEGDFANARVRRVAATAGSRIMVAGRGVILSDGTFVGPFVELADYFRPLGQQVGRNRISEYNGQANARSLVVSTTDGGRLAISPIGDFYLDWPIGEGPSAPSLAVDATTGPFKDRIYSIWADGRSGRTRVYVASSKDKGVTWTNPTVVSDVPRARTRSGAEAFSPAIAVNGNGVVGVIWFDRRDHETDDGWSVRFATSLDGGDSFTSSVRIGDGGAARATESQDLIVTETEREVRYPTQRPNGRVATFALSPRADGSDAASIAAGGDGSFHALWTQRGANAGVATATITATGVAARNGGGQVATMTDVTSKLGLAFVNRIYDRTQGTVEADVVLHNPTATDTVRGPFIVRVINVGSEYGTARLATAPMGQTGSGMDWDFTPLAESGRLAPGERTRPMHVVFNVSDLPPYGPGSDAVAGYVTIRTRTYAATPKGAK